MCDQFYLHNRNKDFDNMHRIFGRRRIWNPEAGYGPYPFSEERNGWGTDGIPFAGIRIQSEQTPPPDPGRKAGKAPADPGILTGNSLRSESENQTPEVLFRIPFFTLEPKTNKNPSYPTNADMTGRYEEAASFRLFQPF